MGFNCGIIGLPNVGKSTLFNALSSAGAQASNFAFCTVEPNIGRVDVPDERLAKLAEISKSKKTIPTQMEIVDIAGLVKGASKGEGLGNKFLSNIRAVDAVIHLVRCFDSSDVVHVIGDVDPIRDIEIIETELMLSDLESVEKKIYTLRKSVKGGNKGDAKLAERLEKIAEGLQKGTPASETGGAEISTDLPLLTAKPVLFVANISDPSEEKNEHAEAVRAAAGRRGAEFLTICAATEAEIAELSPEERPAFLEEMGLSDSGLNRLIQKGYSLLGLITYLTSGPMESRAWTITKGDTAVEAAGKIHTDISKGFIRAEVIPYDDYVNCGGEQGAKEAGKMRLEGKEYVVNDGDVIYFRFNV